MTTDQILLGLGLTAALAVGSQVLASRLRIPAIIVLLPVGFAAGALTSDVNPGKLFGQIRDAELELASGEPLAAADGALLEGVTMVLLLTGEADFDALASTMLQGNVDGPVYRLRPPSTGHGVVAPYTGGQTLFGAELSGPVVAQRYADGAHVTTRPRADPAPAVAEALFVIRANGKLVPLTGHRPPAYRDGGTTVLLVSRQPAAGSPAAGSPAAGSVPVQGRPAGQRAPKGTP